MEHIIVDGGSTDGTIEVLKGRPGLIWVSEKDEGHYHAMDKGTRMASGEVVDVSAASHPDLFWALRGGGGNFGVVTTFEFRAHPIGTEVLSGLIVHPLAPASAIELGPVAERVQLR